MGKNGDIIKNSVGFFLTFFKRTDAKYFLTTYAVVAYYFSSNPEVATQPLIDAGADEVRVCTNPVYEHYIHETYAEGLVNQINKTRPQMIFLSASNNGKELAADGIFFNQGGPFNQGNIYTFDTDEFVAAMETAETKVGTVNEQGIKLQKEFTYEKTLNKILEVIQSDTDGVTPTETA